MLVCRQCVRVKIAMIETVWNIASLLHEPHVACTTIILVYYVFTIGQGALMSPARKNFDRDSLTEN